MAKKKNETRKIDWTSAAAWIALVVSVIQLVLSTPMLLNLYFHPELRGEKMPVDKGSHLHRFTITNLGNATAHNVDIVVTAIDGDAVRLTPPVGTAEVSSTNMFVDHRFRVDHLIAGERMVIIVDTSTRTGKSTSPFGQFIQSSFPQLRVLRSEEGVGELTGWPSGGFPIYFPTTLQGKQSPVVQ